MTSTAVIQVKQGIGDVVWHLPFIRAIAAAEPEGMVSFLTLPSTHARELLQAEPCVAEVVYFEHKGSELARGVHLALLVALLRKRRFRKVWILDRTVRPALAAKLAGIPERIGLGLGPQRWFITNPGIDPRDRHAWMIEWLRELMAAMNVPLASAEPELKLPRSMLAAMAARHAGAARPWTVIALGASHTSKDWPDTSWIAFLDMLRRQAAGTVFLIGGPGNAARADVLIARSAGTPALNLCHLTVIEAAALLQLADLFVGPDSGPMNLAAAGGTPAFALFGSTPVHRYSRFIHAIEPADGGGPTPDGMGRILPAQVFARIEPYLGTMKTP